LAIPPRADKSFRENAHAHMLPKANRQGLGERTIRRHRGGPMFVDRKDAGERLARALEEYREKEDVLVLAIPRGGVEVGYQVAKYLRARFSLIITRKLPFPDNPEAGFGAIAEDGSAFIFPNATFWLSKETVCATIEEQKEEVKRRILALRKGRPLPEIGGQKVILVDDGIPWDRRCRHRFGSAGTGASRVAVAVPVAGERVAKEIGQLADEVVILEKPTPFYAVAQAYVNWYDVSDEEVIETMERWEAERPLAPGPRGTAGEGEAK